MSAGILALALATITAAPRYPFPRNAAYRYGTAATNRSASGSEIQSAFDAWKANQIDSSSAYMRVKFDDPSTTVSEGIGYGMLIMVYMDNAANDTRSQFDKLWAYYRKWSNTNGVMNWKVSGFSSVIGQNGATDAELDAALALLIAYKQWGDPTYLADAKALIASIWKNEVNLSKRLKPGDAWDAFKNPSYISPAAFELFGQVDGNDWKSVLANEYQMLDANTSKQSSGLPSDWCDATGNPVNGNSTLQFGYDAIRTPWRVALGYSWFGHPQAKTIDSRLLSWSASAPISGVPGNIKDGYGLDGSVNGSWNVATFVGAFGAAGLVDPSSSQGWVDKCYARLKVGADGSGYFHSSLKVLYLLHMSGNLNNFWDTLTPPSTGIDSRSSACTLVRLQQTGRHLRIEVPEGVQASVELTDLAGRSLRQAALSGASFSWDLARFPRGVYLVQAKTGQAKTTHRIALAEN
jgi:endoglucanase